MWYDTVYALPVDEERANASPADVPAEWKVMGKLPKPLGYGVSVTHRESVICVGGSDSRQHSFDVFRLTVIDGNLETTPMPSLPSRLANSCGAVVESVLYVAGGIASPEATEPVSAVYALDLERTGAEWHRIQSSPGPARMLGIASNFGGEFWLIGGTDLVPGADGKPVRRYLRDAWRYSPQRGWRRAADLPRPCVAAPSPAPDGRFGPLILSGDDGLQLETPPLEHRGFPQSVLSLSEDGSRWLEVGEFAAAQVTAPVVRWKSSWLILSGEVRPGIRSPAVWQLSFPPQK